jgi:ABC-type uncharacterized transport system permease subunit
MALYCQAVIVAAMLSPTVLSLIALVSLLPATLQPWLPDPKRGWQFWSALALALLGSLNWLIWRLQGHWPTALPADLWITIAISLALYAVVSALNQQAWRLAALMMPYFLVLAILAWLSASHEGAAISPAAPAAWIDTHILVSVATLGLLTLAASAALACFIQARALKLKRPTRLSRMLPSVHDSEMLYEKLLIVSEIILAAGVATGMATQWAESRRLLVLDHKSLFSLLAFATILGLIFGRRWGGVRGQWAVRFALLAYSFVLLGYFGVKFVRQVLL